MARKLAFPAAVAAMTLALVGCNGDNGDDNGDNGGAEAAGGGSLPDLRAEYGGDDWPTELQFVSIPSEEQTELVQQYETLISMFEEALEVEIESSEVTAYAAVIEAMGAGTADIANFGPFSFVVAADTAGAQPVAVAIDEPGAEPSYVSYLVTLADNNDINGIEDVEGTTVCFVDEVSTSGFLYPTAGLMEIGLEAEEDYSSYYSGGHDNSVLAVLDGTCDAAFAYDTMVDEQMIESGDLEEGQVKVVWESEDIPSAPFAASGELPDSMVEAMEEILIEYLNTDWLAENGYCDDADPESGDCRNLVPTADWGYIEASDSVFDGIRAVCEITQADACEG
ncbi:phosphate/phosphite/phosphonate ABC transporter substrate-binding protein [Nesterenkonia ebinurensis]|uniref:phosphate/phosphite/phosphonate ABC transporter substrate-binding protein n=1 Tax=Nesterenkonia ebinurensis TaxID=2608252 RepID=UPI00123DAB8B|nr:phosphate/phosphite/phosphonate ABC transporter substrate-binding protein [Nesterenkonia ebinurensis]